MSTAYLSVLFKTEVGTSYVKYLTDLRIKKAKKLLQDGYKIMKSVKWWDIIITDISVIFLKNTRA